MLTPFDIVYKTFIIAIYLALACYGFWFFQWRLQYFDYKVINNITIDNGIISAEYIDKISYVMLDVGAYLVGFINVGIISIVQACFEIVFIVSITNKGYYCSCPFIKFFPLIFIGFLSLIVVMIEVISVSWRDGVYYDTEIEYKNDWEEYSDSLYLPSLSCETNEYKLVYNGNITSTGCTVYDHNDRVVTLCCGNLRYIDHSIETINRDMINTSGTIVGVTFLVYTLEYLTHGLLYGCNGNQRYKCYKESPSDKSHEMSNI